MRQAVSDQFRAKTIALLLFMGLVFADAVVAFYLLRGKILLNLDLMAPKKSAIYLPLVINLPEQPAQSATPTPTAQTAAETPEVIIYIVQAGDTLFEIAMSHGVSLEDLARANDIEDVDLILVGQELVIPSVPPTALPPETTSSPESYP